MGNTMPYISIQNNIITINKSENDKNDYSKKESFLNQHSYYMCNVNNLFIIAIFFSLYKDIAKELYKDTCNDIIPNNEMVGIDELAMDGRKIDLTNIDPSVIPVARNAFHHSRVRFHNQPNKSTINEMFSQIMFLNFFIRINKPVNQESNFNVLISKGILNEPDKFTEVFFDILGKEDSGDMIIIKEKITKYANKVKNLDISDEIKIGNIIKYILIAIILIFIQLHNSSCIEVDKLITYLDNYMNKDIDKTSKIFSNYIVLQSISSNKYVGINTNIINDTVKDETKKIETNIKDEINKIETPTVSISGNLTFICCCICCYILLGLGIYGAIKLMSKKQ